MRPPRRVELFFALALVFMAVYQTVVLASVHAPAGTHREDALAQLGERMKTLPATSPLAKVLGLWLFLGLFTSAAVGVALARRARKGEKLEDAIAEPPPWSVLDFTLVFLVMLATPMFVVPHAHLVLEDGRSFTFEQPVLLGGATLEGKQGTIHVVIGPRPVLVNGVAYVGTERALFRGDRIVVDGVTGTLLPTQAQYLAALVVANLVAPVLALVVVRARGGRLRDLGLTGFSFREVVRGGVGYFALIPGFLVFMFLSSYLCLRLGVPFEEHPILEGLESDHGPRTLALVFLLVTVVAPVGEEILFRALLLRSMRHAFGSLGLAILASSFFFGAFHPGLASLLPIGWVGFVFAALYATSPRRSILASIVCHALFNGVSVAINYAMLS